MMMVGVKSTNYYYYCKTKNNFDTRTRRSRFADSSNLARTKATFCAGEGQQELKVETTKETRTSNVAESDVYMERQL